MRNQLIFMNLWHYVEIENVDSISIVTSKKVRKIRIKNFKSIATMRNRLKCNDKNLCKNEINAKNAWKFLKNSFSSFESEMLNDLLIKIWIIILINNQNVTNYAQDSKRQCRTFEKWSLTCRLTIIFLFCTFIWVLMRSLSNIENTMLRLMRLCRTSQTRLWALITRSIDF